MPTDPIPTNYPNYKLAGGYALLGFGGSCCVLAAMTFRMIFIPGRRGGPMAAFSPHHPIAIICAVLLVIGLPMIFLGRWLLSDASPPKPSGKPVRPAGPD